MCSKLGSWYSTKINNTYQPADYSVGNLYGHILYTIVSIKRGKTLFQRYEYWNCRTDTNVPRGCQLNKRVSTNFERHGGGELTIGFCDAKHVFRSTVGNATMAENVLAYRSVPTRRARRYHQSPRTVGCPIEAVRIVHQAETTAILLSRHDFD